MVEFVLGLLEITIAIYLFKTADKADENEIVLVDICLVSGALILTIALIPTVIGLVNIIQYFIH